MTSKSGPAFAASMRRILIFSLVLLSILAFLFKGYRDEQTVLHFRDFKQPYASARCLLHGCNPYSEQDTRTEFLKAGGVDDDSVVFQPYSALYPPFSFAVLTPVAALNYRQAHALWFWTSGALFSVAALLMAELCVSFPSVLTAAVLAVFVATSTILLMLGQISGPVIALLAIGLWCVLRERLWVVGVLALSIALLLKPHDAWLLVLYVPLVGRYGRHLFWRGVVPVTVLLAVAGTLWCAYQPASARWLADLEHNLRGNTTAGNVNDPALPAARQIADLQTLVAPFAPRPAAYNNVSHLLAALLLLAWAYPAFRMRPSLAKHVLAIAPLACLTLLPIYHRQYDTRLLLLIFPAVALLLAWRKRWGVPAVLLSALATVFTSHTYLRRLEAHGAGAFPTASPLRTDLFYRPLALSGLVLAVFFIAAQWAAYREEPTLPATQQHT